MFKYCPKIERICAFCGEANWNPMKDERTDEPVLFCGATTGYETRVSPLPECWLDMSKPAQTKYRKQKKAEYEALNPRSLNYKTVGSKRYKKSY
jgi:hypothetical protein